MSDKTIYRMHAGVCKALAHPIRIEIIDILQTNEMTFSEILEKTGGLKSNVSQHLTIMVSKGILNQRKEGQNVYFKLSSRKVANACRLMREVLIDNIDRQNEIIKNLEPINQ